MTKTHCARCAASPAGERGHAALTYQVEGPFPGRHIFRCVECDERWIRHYGSVSERFAWTRYGDVIAMRVPRPVGSNPKVMS